jgi:DNA-3-methyladenine glycosylase
MIKLEQDFFIRDVLEVAPELTGKYLTVGAKTLLITEVEAYRGEDDKACHASKGRTNRTEIMYHKGGHIYVYLIYGIYWMLNIVTGAENNPQAILIRGIEGYNGPGKLTRFLDIDGTFYGENVSTSKRIWISDNNLKFPVKTSPRIGIDYACEPWVSKPWRYEINRE